MAGYIGSKASVTQVDGYNRTEADSEFVQVAGDTMTGDLSVTGTVQSTVSTTGDFNFRAISTGGGNYRIYPDDATTANPTWLHQSNSSEEQAWVIGGVERMRITSGGDVLISKTSSVAAGAGLWLYDSGGNYGRINYGTSITSTSYPAVFYNSSGIGVGSIAYTTTSTAYNTTSDYRLKTDAQPMTGASARVQALNPVNFEWIADGTRVDGFLAHEAQSVVPEAVTGTKDAVNADGNPDYQGIDQSKLVPLLTAALQEALTKIDELETRITALESNP